MMIVWFHSMFTSQRLYTIQWFTNHVMIVCMVLICRSKCFHSIMISIYYQWVCMVLFYVEMIDDDSDSKEGPGPMAQIWPNMFQWLNIFLDR